MKITAFGNETSTQFFYHVDSLLKKANYCMVLVYIKLIEAFAVHRQSYESALAKKHYGSVYRPSSSSSGLKVNKPEVSSVTKKTTASGKFRPKILGIILNATFQR